jgi:hypothetical protein
MYQNISYLAIFHYWLIRPGSELTLDQAITTGLLTAAPTTKAQTAAADDFLHLYLPLVSLT